jgi:hypothetical protein
MLELSPPLSILLLLRVAGLSELNTIIVHGAAETPTFNHTIKFELTFKVSIIQVESQVLKLHFFDPILVYPSIHVEMYMYSFPILKKNTFRNR